LSVSTLSDPQREQRRLAARARWGEEPRVVRLDDLNPQQRRLVLALVDAARKEATTVSVTPVVAKEIDGAGRRLPPAA
jgi:hypothetical protein